MSFVYTESKRHGKKFRGGCFNCKSRKIKCSETLPTCKGCHSRDLYCIYPSRAQRWNLSRKTSRRINDTSSQLTINSPDPGLSVFKAADFRYFHHFFTAAYPHLPYGSDSAWTGEIPRLAHHYEPLLHAILSLGSSHSALLSSGHGDIVDTIVHRGKALAGLRRMLAKEHFTNPELDAMLGICYCLTLQSGYMRDSLADFVIMMRGCALVTERIIARGPPSTAFCLDPTSHVQSMLQRLQFVSGLDPVLLQDGIQSLEDIGGLLKEDSHRRFHHTLLQTLLSLQRSGLESYVSCQQLYVALFTMEESTFQKFMAAENSLTHILFAYFAAVLVLMQPFLSPELPERLSMYDMFGCTYRWLDMIHHRLPVEMRGYIKWPFGVTRAFRFNYRAFGKDAFGLIQWVLASASDKIDQPESAASCDLALR